MIWVETDNQIEIGQVHMLDRPFYTPELAQKAFSAGEHLQLLADIVGQAINAARVNNRWVETTE